MRRKMKLVGIVFIVLMIVSLHSVINPDHSTQPRGTTATEVNKPTRLLKLPPVVKHPLLNLPRFRKLNKQKPNNTIHGELVRHWKDRFKVSRSNKIDLMHTITKPKFVPIDLTYFTNRTRRITSYDHDFIIPSSACSKSKPVFLLILCISKYSHVTTRQTIRQTWGSVSETDQWPLSSRNISGVRVMFELGGGGLDWKQRAAFVEEDRRYGDIIVADFIDSYYNLTRKVIVGLKWAAKYCSETRFILKVDEDTFIHVDNLVGFLKTLEVPSSGLIIGHIYTKPPVMRRGKWGLENTIYPFSYFPPYVSGNSYVVSGNIASKMVRATEYCPYVFIEDVAITGIVRRAINASLYHDKGFTFFARPPPLLCDFHNDTIKSATKTSDGMKIRIWKALHDTVDKCKLVEHKRYSRHSDFANPRFNVHRK